MCTPRHTPDGGVAATLYGRGIEVGRASDLTPWPAPFDQPSYLVMKAEGVESLECGDSSYWRLPSALDTAGSDPCQAPICNGGDFAHLSYDERGVTAGSSIPTGNLAKLALLTKKAANGAYRTGTDRNGLAVLFNAHAGQGSAPRVSFGLLDENHAVPVRCADVSAVPEPEAAATRLLGGCVR